MMRAFIDSLFSYNDWANEKVITLCDGLDDEALDQPRPMGMGTLRSTLFHILSADVIWLERWQGVPWRAFPLDPGGISVAEIAKGLRETSAKRAEWIETHRENHWDGLVEYLDSGKTPFRHQLSDLLLHVFFHGIHHRAQALNYLKPFERTLAGGIDFIFQRLALGAIEQSTEAVETLQQYGMSVNEEIGPNIEWDGSIVQRMYEYNDWAVRHILTLAAQLDDDALDRSFDIGQGSIRKILLHHYDVEQWWTKNWTTTPGQFPHTDESTPIDQLTASWNEISETRRDYLKTVDQQEADRVVEISFGGPPLRIQICDSVCQVAMHGAHHRAQLLNLFRRVEKPSENIDLFYALATM